MNNANRGAGLATRNQLTTNGHKRIRALLELVRSVMETWLRMDMRLLCREMGSQLCIMHTLRIPKEFWVRRRWTRQWVMTVMSHICYVWYRHATLILPQFIKGMVEIQSTLIFHIRNISAVDILVQDLVPPWKIKRQGRMIETLRRSFDSMKIAGNTFSSSHCSSLA